MRTTAPKGHNPVPLYTTSVSAVWCAATSLVPRAQEFLTVLTSEMHDNVQAYLQGIHIPSDHRAVHFMSADMVKDLIDVS